MSELKHLLPPVNRYFKANLHTHTTISDGVFSPEETVQMYKERGYQILALTDHNVIVNHQNLTTEDFLMLTGVEHDISEPNFTRFKKTYHINFIAKRPDSLWQPVAPDDDDLCPPYSDRIIVENMEKIYSVEQINKIVAKANEMGYLVMYNHPVWSRQNYVDYAGLKGFWAMEICNWGCCAGGWDENNGLIYQDMLMQGNRIFPVGADDMHNAKSFAGAWIMVGAEKLEYSSVIEALEKGDFYASTGPDIFELTLRDGGIVHVRCSDAQCVTVETSSRNAFRCNPTDRTGLLREATFDLRNWISTCHDMGHHNEFFRITVTGPYGQKAYTRAYWFEEL